jgi:hypothetical protein
VTPRLPLGPHPCNAFALTPGLPSSWFDYRASSWLTPLQALCLGREPKARVATCCQYATDDYKVCVGLTSISIKETQSIL